ncbi:MAG: RNA-binding protein [Candidatus Omnitrophica bacterium]|nr:RNA-binding protein [Candidatus Omnitrophota bacterium]MBD3269409.1 RNA-binding protein [Candidatus Omnitrophota bacterium]
MEEPKKIYIGNLEYSVTESELKSLFEEKGLNVEEVKLISDKYTGRAKGFGFAEFATEEDAQKAIDQLNGQELKGRTLRVNKAQKMKPRKNNFGNRDRFSGPRPRNSRF